jgi:transcriptional regulator with XRE-family HTH domain
MPIVQKIIKQKIDSMGISANSLAKIAGIPTSSLKNILQGKVESPRAQTLHALARAMKCRVEELMFSNPESAYPDSTSNSNSSIYLPAPNIMSSENFDATLYSQAVQVVTEVATKMEFPLNRDIALRFAECAYDYALSAAKTTGEKVSVDLVFVTWLLEREKSRTPIIDFGFGNVVRRRRRRTSAEMAEDRRITALKEENNAA